jgi:hypothetical protein
VFCTPCSAEQFQRCRLAQSLLSKYLTIATCVRLVKQANIHHVLKTKEINSPKEYLGQKKMESTVDSRQCVTRNLEIYTYHLLDVMLDSEIK